MGSLPRSAVRARATAAILLVLGTAVLLVLAIVLTDVAMWFLILITFIDIPAAILLGFAERAERREA